MPKNWFLYHCSPYKAFRPYFFAFSMVAIVNCDGSGVEWDLSPEFEAWLPNVTATEPSVEGLTFAYFEPTENEATFLSPNITAQTLRYQLALGNFEKATELGDTILKWQEAHDSGFPHIAGAFPSRVLRSEVHNPAYPDGWEPDQMYDSADNLVIIEGLLTLYEQTGQQHLLRAATRSADWLVRHMGRGSDQGLSSRTSLENIDSPSREGQRTA